MTRRISVPCLPALLPAVLAVALSACGRSPADAAGPSTDTAAPVQAPAAAGGVPNARAPAGHVMAVELGASMYAGLEACGADGARLEATKKRFADMATQREGIPRADFDAAFDARLAKARSRVEAEAAMLSEAHKQQACQDMLRKP